MYKKIEIELAGRTLSIEMGKMAKQANGSVVVSYGGTMVLVTAVTSRKPRDQVDFLPLTVEYQERFYAVGQIPGSFFRREIGRPSEKETLTSRLIDRPIRPLFPEGYNREIQVIATVLSADQENDPDILAMIGASTALTISDIPFNGPIAGLRVGMIDGEYVINPTSSELKKSSMELVVAGTGKALVMVEGGADSVGEEEILSGLFLAHETMQPLLDIQKELQKERGRQKITFISPEADAVLREKVIQLAGSGMEEVIATADKMERSAVYHDLEDRVLQKLEGEEAGFDRHKEASAILHDLKKEMMRKQIVEKKERIGGRAFDEIRQIDTEISLLPKAHGSALFTRGETQALVTATLGSGDDEQLMETLEGISFRQFMLHYNFPPFCVGEARFMRGPSRRDIGHGALAGRAIKAILPDPEDFPYTVRVVSDVMESNGSSSMATVCGGSLALMDAGVPVKQPVSGVAMGLIKEGDEVVILSDILGDEDHLGDMDFKVCGTRDGITAVQMDIKIEGVSREIMSQALEQARRGRLHILEKMAETMQAHRQELPAHAPRIFTITINPEKIKDVIGPGGKVIKGLSSEFNVKIDIDDSGRIKIFASDGEAAQDVVKKIEEIAAEAEVGKVYTGIVQKIVDFGAFVEILPGTDGLVHISELEDRRVNKVTDVLSEGDEVKVKVLAIDERGKIKLSRKAVLKEQEEK